MVAHFMQRGIHQRSCSRSQCRAGWSKPVTAPCLLRWSLPEGPALLAARARPKHISRRILDTQAWAEKSDGGSKGTAVATTVGKKVMVKLSIPFRVNFGEIIKVVGTGKDFGSWEVKAAPRFTWTPGDIWQGSLILNPGIYEYKVVIVNETTQESRWETSANRVLDVPEGPGTLSLSCYWNSPSTKGFFEKGKFDTSVRASSPEPSPSPSRSSSSSSDSKSSSSKESKASSSAKLDEASVLLSRGWDAMLKSTKSSDDSSDAKPSSSSSWKTLAGGKSSSSNGSGSGHTPGASRSPSPSPGGKLRRWVFEDDLADEAPSAKASTKMPAKSSSSSSNGNGNGVGSYVSKLKAVPKEGSDRPSKVETSSSSSSWKADVWKSASPSRSPSPARTSSSGASMSSWPLPTPKPSSSKAGAGGGDSSRRSRSMSPRRSAGDQLLDELGQVTDRLGSMLSSGLTKLGVSGKAPAGWGSALNQMGSSGGNMARSGLRQLQHGVDRQGVMRSMQSMVNSLPSMPSFRSSGGRDEYEDGSRHRSMSPDQEYAALVSRRMMRAVASVVSTKSPSAIRADNIDEAMLRESFKYKPALTSTTTRRPRLKTEPAGHGLANEAATRKGAPTPSRSQGSEEGWTSWGRRYLGLPSSSGRAKTPNPKIKLEVEVPVAEVQDPAHIAGMAVVTAAVVGVLGSDTYGITSMLNKRSDAMKQALLAPVPSPALERKTPKPAAKTPTAPPVKSAAPAGAAAKKAPEAAAKKAPDAAAKKAPDAAAKKAPDAAAKKAPDAAAKKAPEAAAKQAPEAAAKKAPDAAAKKAPEAAAKQAPAAAAKAPVADSKPAATPAKDKA